MSLTTKTKIWQWPNLLAIDASIIALSWLWVYSNLQEASPGSPAFLVLALSVWLTYVADRLFDSIPRDEAQLLSARHRFTKQHARKIWCVWLLVLILNIILAFTSLEIRQLKAGLVLLACCLVYTALNYWLSRRFFPKELIVALIFASGTAVFLPEFPNWICLFGFFLLCLLNCLTIGWKERPVDDSMQVRSLTSFLNRRWFHHGMILGMSISILANCRLALIPSLLALFIIWCSREKLTLESHRVLCDAALLVGPAVYFLGTGVLVR